MMLILDCLSMLPRPGLEAVDSSWQISRLETRDTFALQTTLASTILTRSAPRGWRPRYIRSTKRYLRKYLNLRTMDECWWPALMWWPRAVMPGSMITFSCLRTGAGRNIICSVETTTSTPPSLSLLLKIICQSISAPHLSVISEDLSASTNNHESNILCLTHSNIILATKSSPT